MPDTAKPRTLITSALPYINGIKHLGNLVGSQLPADVYARFCRATGHEVMFICATDEHGTPAEIAAQNAGQDVAEYCEQMHETQTTLARQFALSFDHFGRSSSPENHRLTQHFATVLEQNGMIEMVSEKQIYSPTDGRFLPDRYIEGTCPHCGYDEARGDQCENCTKQLNPTDLLEARSKISGATNLEVRETNHLYLKQSTMKDALDKWISGKEVEGWPILTTSIAKKWLHDGDGLRDRGITRDLNWGVPVCKIIDDKPVAWDGMEGKVFYVWFDAPIAYIAATAEWAKAKGKDDSQWQRWWRTDMGAEDVNYFQFMGKDNVPFHTLSFPACLMGSGEDWKQVDYIKSFNYLNYDGGQFSTSKGRGVFMDKALNEFPSDYWRWWLMSNVPEGNDSEFTWESFQQTVNKDLSDVLGNFVSRTTKFCNATWGAFVPKEVGADEDEDMILDNLPKQIKLYEEQLKGMEFRKAAQTLRQIWVAGNEYLQVRQPWTLYKTDQEGAAISTRFALNLIVLYANLSEPFIPDTAKKIHKFMGTEPSWPKFSTGSINILSPEFEFVEAGHKFTIPENLFKKITDDQIAELSARFSGES